MRDNFYCKSWKSFLLTEYLGMVASVVLIAFARYDIKNASEIGFSPRGMIIALIGGWSACIFLVLLFRRNFYALRMQQSTANQWPSRHFGAVFLPVGMMLVVNICMMVSFLL